MLNGINNFLSSQVGQGDEVNKVVTNPFSNPYKNVDRSLLIDESAISNQAVKLYQRELDVKQFNNIALSNPENTSHNDIVSSLFSKGIVDPFSNEAVSELMSNARFLEDMGL